MHIHGGIEEIRGMHHGIGVVRRRSHPHQSPRVVGRDSIKCMRLDGDGVTMKGKRLGGSKVNASRACIVMAVVGCRWGLCPQKGTLRDATLGALR